MTPWTATGQAYLSIQLPWNKLLSHVRLFLTPCTVAHQDSLSITNSQSLLKLMSIESVVPSNLSSLGNIATNKASGGDGIPVELFQILKHDAVEVLHSIWQQMWNTHQWPQDWKRCFHSNPKERQCQRVFKLLHNCTHLTRQQNNSQNSPSQTLAVCEPWTSRCSRWV